MTDSVDTWKRLLGIPELLEAAERCDSGDVAAVARLRRAWPADLVAAALELAGARRKAATKFPGRTIVADVAGVEQATSALVADYKARRIARSADARRITDLCCGIGGDAMGLAAAGFDVEAVDRDPLRVWMTHRNAECRAKSADVTTFPVAGLFHFDPDRRARGRRMWRLEDYEPGPDFLRGLLRRCPDGAVKLGPGVDVDALDLPGRGEIEFISEHGRLVQAVLWTGTLAHDPRSATLLPGGRTLRGQPTQPDLAPAGAFIYAVNPALERAGLLGLLGLPAIHPRLGLLTSDARVSDPWLTTFELVEEMPWRLPKVKRWLADHGAGIVEVKTRGKAVDPDRVQRQLRGPGERSFTVFVLRRDRRTTALITRRP